MSIIMKTVLSLFLFCFFPQVLSRWKEDLPVKHTRFYSLLKDLILISGIRTEKQQKNKTKKS